MLDRNWVGTAQPSTSAGNAQTAVRRPAQIEAEVSPDLRLLMFASAAGLDVALKQDDTGGWGFGGVG